MLNRFLTDAYQRVQVTASEVRKTVHDNAQRAKLLFRVYDSYGVSRNAQLLQRQLEIQAAEAVTLPQLHQLYVQWLAHLSSSLSDNDVEHEVLYYDPSVKHDDTTTPFASAALDFAVNLFHPDAPPLELLQESRSLEDLATVNEDRTAKQKSQGDAGQDNSPAPGTLNEEDKSKLVDKGDSVGSGQNTNQNVLSCSTPPFSTLNSFFLSEGYTWKEVFLRSQALELALVTLTQLVEVREKIAAPFDDDNNEASARGVLEKLLKLVMRGDKRTHQELLFLLCTIDLKSETWRLQLKHLVELVSILKFDVVEEQLKRLRQTTIRRLRQHDPELTFAWHHSETSDAELSKTLDTAEKPAGSDIPPTAPSDSATMDSEKQMTTNDKTLEFLELCIKLDWILRLETHKKQQTHLGTAQCLKTLQENVERLAQRFSDLGGQATDKRGSVAAERKAALQTLKEQMEAASTLKLNTSKEVKRLEQQRQELLTQLAAADERLAATRTQEQLALRAFERLNRKWESLMRFYNEREMRVTELEHQSARYRLDMQNTRLLILQSSVFLNDNTTEDASQCDVSSCSKPSTFESAMQTAIEQFFMTHIALLTKEKDVFETLQASLSALSAKRKPCSDAQELESSEQRSSTPKGVPSNDPNVLDDAQSCEQLEKQIMEASCRFDRLWEQILKVEEQLKRHYWVVVTSQKTTPCADNALHSFDQADLLVSNNSGVSTSRESSETSIDGFIDAGEDPLSRAKYEACKTVTLNEDIDIAKKIKKSLEKWSERARLVYAATKDVKLGVLQALEIVDGKESSTFLNTPPPP